MSATTADNDRPGYQAVQPDASFAIDRVSHSGNKFGSTYVAMCLSRGNVDDLDELIPLFGGN